MFVARCAPPRQGSFFGFPAPAAAVCRQGWAACRRTYPWSGRIVKQPPNTGIAAGLTGCPCEISHENTTRVGYSTPRFWPVRRSVFLMSDFKLGIVRLGRVAGKVSWIPALPCASQGKKGPLGRAKTIKKKKTYIRHWHVVLAFGRPLRQPSHLFQCGAG